MSKNISIKEKVIELFKLFEYEYQEESPDGRLLFYDIEREVNCQFWYLQEPNPLSKAAELISSRTEHNARISERCKMQNKIKNILGL